MMRNCLNNLQVIYYIEGYDYMKELIGNWDGWLWITKMKRKIINVIFVSIKYRSLKKKFQVLVRYKVG